MKATDKSYLKQIHFYIESIPKNLEKLVKKKNIFTLLDLGCGDGATLFALKKLGLLRKKTVFAVDISKKRLAQAQKIDKKFRCFVANAADLSPVIKNKTIDLVISSQVIEHLKEPEKFIDEMRRILKARGYLYLTTVYKKWYGWYFYRNKGKWVLDPTHLREYTHEDQLLPMLKKQGFKILKNEKKLFLFPITDFVFRKLGVKRNIYESKMIRFLRKIKVPILGYYYWELVLRKS